MTPINIIYRKWAVATQWAITLEIKYVRKQPVLRYKFIHPNVPKNLPLSLCFFREIGALTKEIQLCTRTFILSYKWITV